MSVKYGLKCKYNERRCMLSCPRTHEQVASGHVLGCVLRSGRFFDSCFCLCLNASMANYIYLLVINELPGIIKFLRRTKVCNAVIVCHSFCLWLCAFNTIVTTKATRTTTQIADANLSIVSSFVSCLIKFNSCNGTRH